MSKYRRPSCRCYLSPAYSFGRTECQRARIHAEVDVRVTERMIEIFHRGQRVDLHERRYMRSGHGTAPEHMPNARRATPRGRRIAFVAGRRRSARTPSDSSSLCSHAASSRAGLSNLPRRVEALSRHRRRPAGLKLPAMIKRTRRFPFVFLTTATHWRPTRAPNGRSSPASLSQGHLLLSQRLGCRTLYRYSLGDRDRTAPRLDASRLTLAGKPLAPPVP